MAIWEVNQWVKTSLFLLSLNLSNKNKQILKDQKIHSEMTMSLLRIHWQRVAEVGLWQQHMGAVPSDKVPTVLLIWRDLFVSNSNQAGAVRVDQEVSWPARVKPRLQANKPSHHYTSLSLSKHRRAQGRAALTFRSPHTVALQ